MNYFEFYELSIGFHLDEGDLKRRYLLKSKKYHPDHFTLESDEKQAETLEISALNNQAYRTLSDFDLRMAYVLKLTGAMGEEGKNEIPQAFLLEMMDINEALMELEFEPDEKMLEATVAKIEQLEKAVFKEVEALLLDFDPEKTDPRELEKVKDFYLKKRYLWRIRQNLNRFAPASKEAPQD